VKQRAGIKQNKIKIVCPWFRTKKIITIDENKSFRNNLRFYQKTLLT